MKTLNVKFNRNPKFTSVNLNERTLSRIEWLVKAHFLRWYGGSIGVEAEVMYGNDAVADMCEKWFAPYWSWEYRAGLSEFVCIPARKARHDKRIAWLANNPDARKYYSACWNYLIAIAKRNGEVIEERQSRGQWAMAMGYI